MSLKTYPKHAFCGELTVVDFETISPTGVATGLTAAKLAAATGKHAPVRALITVAEADIRYRLDGTDPSATVGHIVYDTGVLEVEGITNLAALRFIEVSGTAKISVSYSRYED